MSTCCLFHNSTGSLKVIFLSHVELFTQTEPEPGKWNNRDEHSDITCVFCKRQERSRKEFLQESGQSWILNVTQLQGQIKKTHICWTQNWDSLFNKQQSTIDVEFNYFTDKTKLDYELHFTDSVKILILPGSLFRTLLPLF